MTELIDKDELLKKAVTIPGPSGKSVYSVVFTDDIINAKALEQEPCDKYIKEIDHLRKYIYKLETQIIEQESVLDKVRAEIKQLPTSVCSEIYRMSINADEFKENVLAIIDEYKAESEG